ncbi:L,D-transpeptidase [uncultured Amaricoccus sp.]|uniref:L,D-transpeptidase family protein n=1 Tax=uncultured Amaricoccus sp. TaxID=339341 RepID=UPI00345D39B8
MMPPAGLCRGRWSKAKRAAPDPAGEKRPPGGEAGTARGRGLGRDRWGGRSLFGADLVVGPWGARFRGRIFPCAIGGGGIGEKRAEGDRITPAGRHRIEAVLRRPDRRAAGTPATLLPTHAIGPRDGWSDDPADPDYNHPVLRPRRFGHEALRRPDRMYDLVAVLDWNRHPPVPGRGSAIFLHVWRRPRHPTAGCVAFRPEDLAWILRRWTPRDRVVIRG